MAKSKKLPSLEVLDELFYYDGKNLRNKVRRGANGKFAKGSISGFVDGKDPESLYRFVKIDGVKFRIHRIIWKIVRRKSPKNIIDHIDGDGLNNEISNLRDVEQKVNAKNCKMKSNNSSGFTGINYDKCREKWRARITIDGKERSKRFLLLGDAISWRNSQLSENDFTKNHGIAKG